MYKILIFLKRKPGTSVAEFRNYYETTHAKLALQYSQGVDRYLRRYIDVLPNAETGAVTEPEFDVITELWFKDETIYHNTVQYLSSHTMPQAIIDDEERFLDRGKSKIATVEEVEY
ncbi:EthD domain-containing protein [Halioxenophilus aromaticivorans]|uniref:EthD domain-containing protein n=1 Tax=Halioxenophilus aromaticivorans TaxID=1306992 RepID=A0AAV3U8Q8_9ALTE